DQRDPAERVVLEFLLEERVALLRVGERESRDLLLLGIVVDVEVLAGEDVPVEVLVLDLVLAERHGLRLERTRSGGDDERGERQQNAIHRTTRTARIGSSCMTRSTTSIPALTFPNTV